MNSFLSPIGLALLCVSLMGTCLRVGSGFGTYGFQIHHRYSDPVKGILDIDEEVPEKGSWEYYMALHQRDRLIHGRKLVSSSGDNQTTPLTFSSGNETYRLSTLGYLHYANVSVGTPSLSFLVALDTGSDLFWLPCDCLSCVKGLRSSSGLQIDFNMYSPNTSSTSSIVPCSSSLCLRKSKCSTASENCPYQINYLSNNTSSIGYLVQDVLHLISDDDQLKAVDAQVTLGCGRIQTGSFMDGAAPNGLFGLGMTNYSVPSILAKEGIASNSFSMCFGPDGVGRIRFGDRGSSDQAETPFNLGQSHPTYNITITEINVEGNGQNLEFTAVFDSGTSFTYLNDPAYTLMAESFNSKVQESRYQGGNEIPFEYCYELSSNQTSINVPNLNLTMKGGAQLFVTDSIAIISQKPVIYCLALVRSGDINIIGQNFMTGYRIVFDRERMMLGWKESNCYDVDDNETLPISPAKATAVPPAEAVNPEATAGGSNNSSIAGNPPPASHTSPQLKFLPYTVLLILLPLWAIV